MSLWRGEPIVLASKSVVRRAVLEAASIPLKLDPADIDERAIEAEQAGLSPDAAAALLAREKALAVSRRHDGLVLGADQTLALGEKRYSKPPDIASARAQLLSLAGRTHALHSGIAVAKKGEILFEHVSTARMTMRPLDDTFLDAYFTAAGDRVSKSVGGYQLETLGIHLFERIDGDHFTILGMPMLPLLAFLREQGSLR